MSPPDDTARGRWVYAFVAAIAAVIGLGMVIDLVVIGRYLFTPIAIIIAVIGLIGVYVSFARRRTKR